LYAQKQCVKQAFYKIILLSYDELKGLKRVGINGFCNGI